MNNLKQAQQKLAEADKALYENFVNKATPDTCNQQTQGIGMAGQSQEPLSYRLGRRRNENYTNAAQLDRAIDILQRHPEFEDLLWLLNSGLTY